MSSRQPHSRDCQISGDYLTDNITTEENNITSDAKKLKELLSPVKHKSAVELNILLKYCAGCRVLRVNKSGVIYKIVKFPNEDEIHVTIITKAYSFGRMGYHRQMI